MTRQKIIEGLRKVFGKDPSEEGIKTALACIETGRAIREYSGPPNPWPYDTNRTHAEFIEEAKKAAEVLIRNGESLEYTYEALSASTPSGGLGKEKLVQILKAAYGKEVGS
jgi:hypothetical protein